MTWAKIDDHANEHHKQDAAGAEACWMWTCGLMYANRQASRDGFIPEHMVKRLYRFKSPGRLAERLVTVGLWERVEGGFQIHEFSKWNRTRDELEIEREKGRERAARSYEKKRVLPEVSEVSSDFLRPKNSNSSLKNHDSSGEGVEREGEGSLSSLPDPRSGTHLKANSVHGERDIQALSSTYLRDEFSGSLGAIGGGQAHTWPEVLAVCAAFQRVWGKQVTLRAIGLKDPRLKVILERLAEGHSLAELVRAIERSKFADYIVGNQANQTLMTILRDTGQVEKFGALTSAPMKPERGDPRNEAQDRNADHDTRATLDASRKVREMLAFSDRMKTGSGV